MTLFAPEALYINCPFLPPALEQRYQRALQHEIKQFVQAHGSKKTVRSMFIAGVPVSYAHPPLDTLGILRVMTLEEAEISLVAERPLSEHEVAVWQEVGVNRINYRMQDGMSRRWTTYFQDAQNAAPFERFSVDLWLDGNWGIEQLQLLAKAGVQHISLSFGETMDLVQDEEGAERYEAIVAELGIAKYEQYSAHDFALKGYRSVQQELYFSYRPYKGFGVGACSFDGSSRTQTTDSVADYCLAQEGGHAHWFVCEQLSAEQQYFERMMLCLMSNGIEVQELVQGKSDEQKEHCLQEIKKMADAALVLNEEGVISLTPRGHLVENEIITKLCNQ